MARSDFDYKNPDQWDRAIDYADRRRDEEKDREAEGYFDNLRNEDGERVNESEPCDYCGGQMRWCSCCNMYTKTCCVEYGTCMCS